jgi:hypothetical protein
MPACVQEGGLQAEQIGMIAEKRWIRILVYGQGRIPECLILTFHGRNLFYW